VSSSVPSWLSTELLLYLTYKVSSCGGRTLIYILSPEMHTDHGQHGI